MTTHFARALSRRRVLSSGLAAMGMTMLAPGLARSTPRSAPPDAVTALAFVAALLALGLMMRLLRSVSFTPYVIYRMVLGVALLAIAYS